MTPVSSGANGSFTRTTLSLNSHFFNYPFASSIFPFVRSFIHSFFLFSFSLFSPFFNPFNHSPKWHVSAKKNNKYSIKILVIRPEHLNWYQWSAIYNPNRGYGHCHSLFHKRVSPGFCQLPYCDLSLILVISQNANLSSMVTIVQVALKLVFLSFESRIVQFAFARWFFKVQTDAVWVQET